MTIDEWNDLMIIADNDVNPFREIISALDHARTKHPGNASMSDRIVALTEEVGEVARAHLDGEGIDRIREEAAQVAAVAIRIMVDTEYNQIEP